MTRPQGVLPQGGWLGEEPEEIRRALVQQREPHDLVQRFAELAGRAVLFEGLEFVHAQPGLGCRVPCRPLSAAADYVFSHPVARGTLHFWRSSPFNETERRKLTAFAGLLQRPLRNAIRHHRGTREYLKGSEPSRSTAQPQPLAPPLEELIANGELDSAIHQGQLSLHYQPKVEMKTGRVVGLEALLRWRHHRHGMISPEHFIPVAERHGRIHAITRWVLEAVIRQCASWRSDGLLVPVAVNLSGFDLAERELPAYVAGLLERWEVPPLFIELEITETAVISDHQRCREVLGQLSQLGIAVAIDDFGTGYSSLQRLKQLPFNTIKIDKSFVMDAARDSQEMVFVDTITQLGHRLGMKVVAEGVECRESWARLAAAGCDMGQGYHISRPLSGEVMSHWLRSGAQHGGVGSG